MVFPSLLIMALLQYYLFPLLFSALTIGLSAGDIAPTGKINLKQALTLGHKRNADFQKQTILFQKARNEYINSRGIWLPTLSLNSTAPGVTSSRSVNAQLPTFNQKTDQYEFFSVPDTITNSVDLKGYLAMTERLPIGGDINIRGGIDYLFSKKENLFPDDLSDRYTNEVFTRKEYITVDYKQPLMDIIFGMPEIKNHEIAGLTYESHSINYILKKKYLTHNITKSFYALFKAAEVRKLAEMQMKIGETFYNQARDKLKIGTISEIESLKIRLNYLEKQNEVKGLLKTEYDRRDQFKRYIGAPESERVDIHVSIEQLPIRLPELADFSKYQSGFPGMRLLKNDRQKAERLYERDFLKSDVALDLSLFLQKANNRDFYTAKDSDDQDSAGAALTLSVPLWDYGNRLRQKENVKLTRQSALLTYEDEVRELRKRYANAVYLITDLKKAIEIDKMKLEIAEKTYTIDVDRLKLSIIDTQTFINSQTALSTAKLNYLDSIINFHLAVSEFEILYFRITQ